MRSRSLWLTLPVALWLLVACGGGDGDDAPADTAAPPDTVAVDTAADAGGGPDVAPPVSVGCGPTLPAPDTAWYRTAVAYEVFVRSFRDSDGDGVGDLRGLIDALDYLNDGDPATDDDLGVDLLWLMPTTEALSYHGYDVTDYRTIDPDYGTLADWDALVVAAEQRGVRIIVDLVLNHTSTQHPWFVGSAAGPDTAYRDWYVWSDEPLDWRQPTGGGQDAWNRRGDGWYYAAFWQGMPDLNYTTPAVTAEAHDISRFWLDRGAAGFRLDAVRFLIETGEGDGQRDTPETIGWWKRYRQALAETHPDAVLVGEAWTNRARVVDYFGAADDLGLHVAFDFDLQLAIDTDLRGGSGPDDIHDAVCGVLEDYPPHAQNAPFLSNHDVPRFAGRVRGDVAKMKLGAALLLTLPGTPFLYYGEEIGLPNGGSPRDEDKRLPMRWDDTPGDGFTTGTPWRDPNYAADAPTVAGQTDDPDSLLSTYRRLIRLRKGEPALFLGRTELLPPESLAAATGDGAALLAYLRQDPLAGTAGDADAATLLVVHNVGEEDLTGVTIDLDGILLTPAAIGPREPLWGDATATAEGRVVTLDALPPWTTTILPL